MPKNTKKAERTALASVRRKIRRKMAAKKAAKTSGSHGRDNKSHPHRRTATMRARARS